MPYLPEQAKIDLASGAPFTNPGDLTYIVTHVVLLEPESNWDEAFAHYATRYIEDRGERFATFAEIIGAFSAADHEYSRRRWQAKYDPDAQLVSDTIHEFLGLFYDKVVAPYENKKIEENGDVFP